MAKTLQPSGRASRKRLMWGLRRPQTWNERRSRPPPWRDRLPPQSAPDGWEPEWLLGVVEA
jgi:hypothetical protein